ncbi:hypothetical protein [Leptospira noguchii]|uniref:Uncharacterized protein n=1 Tax=Leptospira noguchii TaxID=28182 RepID=A0AAE9K9I6_9LEPT|nr:hypothetical protein [Leptospira noguchii]UOG30983.1 hypothetical protein MAL06_02580 [Leptospira noguchii]UOG53133.1 hypothetical protein MAL09_02670 [Leptospira noguchii]UOG57104.1 hypothetical protein MAL03_02560 [Leptospira noguchii]
MLRSIVSSIEFIIRPNFLTSNSRYLVNYEYINILKSQITKCNLICRNYCSLLKISKE